MAKDKTIIKAKAGVKATERALGKDRMGDFGYTNNVMGAIFGNLGTTQRATGAALTGANKRQMAALLKMQERGSRQKNKALARGSATATDLFGIAGQAGARPLLDQAAAHARGSDTSVKGAVEAAAVAREGNKTVMGILGAGVQEARAGAQAQTADALRYRAKNDASIVAEQQALITKARLDAWTFRQNQEALKAAEAKDPNLGGATVVARKTVEANAWFRTWLRDNPGATVPEMTAAYNTEWGENPAMTEMLQLTAGEVRRTVDRETGLTLASAGGAEGRKAEVDRLVEYLLSLYPNYKGGEAALRRAVESGLIAGYSLDGASGAPGGDAPFDPNYVDPDAGTTQPRGRSRVITPRGPDDTDNSHDTHYVNNRGRIGG